MIGAADCDRMSRAVLAAGLASATDLDEDQDNPAGMLDDLPDQDRELVYDMALNLSCKLAGVVGAAPFMLAALRGNAAESESANGQAVWDDLDGQR